jgi:hypothetical protein
MKDALGHGSNGNGSIGADIKERRATFGTYTGPDRRGAAEYPARGDSSNAAAAQALMSGLKSTMVPIHDSMAGRMANPTSAPTPFGRRAGDGVFKGEKTAGQKTNYATVMRARHGSM